MFNIITSKSGKRYAVELSYHDTVLDAVCHQVMTGYYKTYEKAMAVQNTLVYGN